VNIYMYMYIYVTGWGGADMKTAIGPHSSETICINVVLDSRQDENFAHQLAIFFKKGCVFVLLFNRVNADTPPMDWSSHTL